MLFRSSKDIKVSADNDLNSYYIKNIENRFSKHCAIDQRLEFIVASAVTRNASRHNSPLPYNAKKSVVKQFGNSIIKTTANTPTNELITNSSATPLIHKKTSYIHQYKSRPI